MELRYSLLYMHLFYYYLYCVYMYVCVCEISGTEPCIVMHLLPVLRASPGEVHNLLDMFLTQTQSGECAICLSLRFQHTSFQFT